MTTESNPLEYYQGLEYSLNIIADPDGGYVAVFPDLPGCMTQGETLEEAIEMAQDARIGWLECEYDRTPMTSLCPHTLLSTAADSTSESPSRSIICLRMRRNATA